MIESEPAAEPQAVAVDEKGDVVEPADAGITETPHAPQEPTRPENGMQPSAVKKSSRPVIPDIKPEEMSDEIITAEIQA